jgi:hypothetical protein
LFNWTWELFEKNEQCEMLFSSSARPTINSTSIHWKKLFKKKVESISYRNNKIAKNVYGWKDETFGIRIVFLDQ